MDKIERFNYLLGLYQSENISDAERQEFLELLASEKYDAALGRAIEHDLVHGFENKTADLPPHIAQEIVMNIFKAEQNSAKILPLKQQTKKTWYWMAAASILVILFSAYVVLRNNKNETVRFAALIPSSTITTENKTANPQLITLSDGSVITLKPKSVFHYPKNFDGQSREVYLEGEAFFEIVKDPNKPFLVYYNNIVTKVLGTSFTINTNSKTGNVEVAVKTGRVQVYENEKIVKTRIALKSVIITPNQKVIYQVDTRIFATTLVELPEPIEGKEKSEPGSPEEDFVYEQENLAGIFKQLEKRYGIDIIVENSNIENCVFTGDVTSQDLFTKLKIICLATNSSYEVNDTKILIKGAGCN